MKHDNLDMPKTYTTFAELAEYARQRAKISANRRGHQEFVYWAEVARWADEGERLNCDIKADFDRTYKALSDNEYWARQYRGFEGRNKLHWQAVHLRQMLKNRGENPPRLSLKWLREAAERL